MGTGVDVPVSGCDALAHAISSLYVLSPRLLPLPQRNVPTKARVRFNLELCYSVSARESLEGRNTVYTIAMLERGNPIEIVARYIGHWHYDQQKCLPKTLRSQTRRVT